MVELGAAGVGEEREHARRRTGSGNCGSTPDDEREHHRPHDEPAEEAASRYQP
jgi:hypothetical protein